MKASMKIISIIAVSVMISLYSAKNVYALDIITQEQCQEIGGAWNECPPNECQKSEAYKKGEVMCPQVCGEPLCEGIIPEGKEDLSEIQNPTLFDEKLETQTLDGEQNKNTTALPSNPSPSQGDKSTTSAQSLGNNSLLSANSRSIFIALIAITAGFVVQLWLRKRAKRK